MLKRKAAKHFSFFTFHLLPFAPSRLVKISCFRHLEKPIKTKENKVKHFLFILLFLSVLIGFILFF